MTQEADFSALDAEFDWLASVWAGFVHELADAAGTLRRIGAAMAADRTLAAESPGLSALESATERLVQEMADDVSRIRLTLATYEKADAAVHVAATSVSASQESASRREPPGVPRSAVTRVGIVPAQGVGDPESSDVWRPEPAEVVDPLASTLSPLSSARRDILARAEHWVAQQVPYAAQAWHEGYRTDCSGYVSMCWGLPESLVTSKLPHVSHPIAREALKAGDALVNTDAAAGHAVLFDRWADYAHTSYVGFELSPSGTVHHVIPYPYFEGHGRFAPYRLSSVGD